MRGVATLESFAAISTKEWRSSVSTDWFLLIRKRSAWIAVFNGESNALIDLTDNTLLRFCNLPIFAFLLHTFVCALRSVRSQRQSVVSSLQSRRKLSIQKRSAASGIFAANKESRFWTQSVKQAKRKRIMLKILLKWKQLLQFELLFMSCVCSAFLFCKFIPFYVCSLLSSTLLCKRLVPADWK